MNEHYYKYNVSTESHVGVEAGVLDLWSSGASYQRVVLPDGHGKDTALERPAGHH